MKKFFLSFMAVVILSLISQTSYSQATVAQDFHRADCNGSMHHLYDDLDSGNIVVLEFFMDSCTFCVNTAHALEKMEQTLKAHHGAQFVGYSLAFTDIYPKQQCADWVSVNNLRTIPMDSGAAMVNYYGGFGMPTVVFLGGRDHKVISSVLAFLPRDTTDASTAILSYMNTAAGIEPVSASLASVDVYPNPVSSMLNIEMTAQTNTQLSISIVNMQGQTVSEMSERITAGKYSKHISISQLPAGLYTVRLSADGHQVSRNISVVK